MAPIEPNALIRNAKGFPKDHPAGELLRARNFGVTAPLTAAEVLSPGLGALVAAHFRSAAPLVALLNEPFLGGAERSESAIRM